MLIDTKRLADDGRRAIVARLPELVGDNNDWLSASTRYLFGPREPTRRGPEAEHGKEVSRDELPIGSLVVIGGADGEGRHPVGEQCRQRWHSGA